VSPEEYEATVQRNAIYERFFRQLHGDGARQPADCVVLSVNNQNVDYPKSIGQCLQERGLSVEMLYLQVESGLTRALQDVRSDGSPLCILVEQTNVTLSSCTVIIFSESLKITSAEVGSDVAPVINSLPPGLGKPPPLLPAGSGPPPREQANPPSGSGDTPPGHHRGLQGSYPKTKPPPLLSMQNLKPPSHRSAAPHSLLPSRASSVSHGSSFSPPSRGPAAPHSLDKPQPLLGPAPTHGPSSTRAPLLDRAPLLETPLGFPSSRGLLQHPGSHSSRGPPLMCGPPPQNGPWGPRAPPPSLRSLHMGAPTGPCPPRRLLP
ncbi:hypothetical protein cypCar_00005946, partial [Cyprinus carpio]